MSDNEAHPCLRDVAGLAGFVLKSHYVSTAERAAVVSQAVPGCHALGGVALNAAVGGLNPMAVEIAAREGARIVWMPTVDAANHRRTAHDLPPGATPPMWLALQEELRRRGLEAKPVEVLGADGAVLPAVRAVLDLVAGHGLVLATGHLGRTEILAVTQAAVEAGVRQVIITGPAGTAATRKLVRSVFHRGMAAAVVESLRAARADLITLSPCDATAWRTPTSGLRAGRASSRWPPDGR